MTTTADRPNLELARQFTRDLGPATMIAGALIAIHGLVCTLSGRATSNGLSSRMGCC